MKPGREKHQQRRDEVAEQHQAGGDALTLVDPRYFPVILQRAVASFGIASEICTLAALTLICLALRDGVGFHDLDVALIAAAAVLTVAARFTARREPATASWCVVAAALAATSYLSAPSWRLLTAAAAVAAMVGARRPVGSAVFVVAAALAAAPLFWSWSWGQGSVDVFTVVQQAAGELLHLHNPYDMLASVSGRVNGQFAVVQIHFPYGPTIPLLAAPARWLGDVRVAGLAMIAILYAGLAMTTRRSTTNATGRRRLLTLAAVFPLIPFMVLAAWVDVYTAAGLALWMALRDRHPRWAAPALAAALATKPTAVLALVPSFIWSRSGRREILAGGLLAALLCLPFALASGAAQFVRDVGIVPFQIFGDPRPDATTLDAWLLHHGYPVLPAWVAPAGMIVVAALLLRRRPRDWGDLLIAGAAINTVGLLLAKQAFYNYYFLSAALLLLALAARGHPLDAPAPVRSRAGRPAPTSSAPGSRPPATGATPSQA